MLQLFQENKALIRFLLICLSGYLLWVILYNHLIGPDQRLDFWLSGIEAKEVMVLFEWSGHPLERIIELEYKHVFYSEGRRIVGFATSCNGLVLFPLFSFFILATNGSWKRKTVYILIGCLLIYHVNIARIVGLILIKKYYPQSLDFNHKYTFTILVYSFIFYLWYLWVNYYSIGQEKKHD
ncbi:MAG TPA: archaeosortase/exosortase family protein [Cytophagaceae bacterium]|jgi:exosortase family protein XrtF|nr:archaeosortase/exosortase family protein [Cytophagaceae bacterium]